MGIQGIGLGGYSVLSLSWVLCILVMVATLCFSLGGYSVLHGGHSIHSSWWIQQYFIHGAFSVHGHDGYSVV